MDQTIVSYSAPAPIIGKSGCLVFKIINSLSSFGYPLSTESEKQSFHSNAIPHKCCLLALYRTTASSFVHVNTNASYGGSRALPLLPSQTLPTPKDHAYARPDYFSMNKTQTTPFSTATEIVPGRLIKTRYTDMKMDLKSRKPVLQPGQMDDEDFYQQ